MRWAVLFILLTACGRPTLPPIDVSASMNSYAVALAEAAEECGIPRDAVYTAAIYEYDYAEDFAEEYPESFAEEQADEVMFHLDRCLRDQLYDWQPVYQ